MRVSFFFFFFQSFIFCDIRFYTSNKQNSTQNWNAFWKIIVQNKCQVSKNFKQSFLKYIENTTGSVRNFAKCMYDCVNYENQESHKSLWLGVIIK